MANKKMGAVTLNDDQKWRAESDMRTLMDAEAIKKDAKRLAAAKEIAKKKYDEMEEAGLCGKHKGGKTEETETSEKDDM